MTLRRRSNGPFDIVARGYDRSQVESYMQESQAWTTNAWNRIQDLEAKVIGLEEVCTASERDRKEASELAEQARVRVSESKQTGTEIILAAEARANKILATAARSIEQAQEEVDRFAREVDTDEERIHRADAASRISHLASESIVNATVADEGRETTELPDRPRFSFSAISPGPPR